MRARRRGGKPRPRPHPPSLRAGLPAPTRAGRDRHDQRRHHRVLRHPGILHRAGLVGHCHQSRQRGCLRNDSAAVRDGRTGRSHSVFRGFLLHHHGAVHLSGNGFRAAVLFRGGRGDRAGGSRPRPHRPGLNACRYRCRHSDPARIFRAERHRYATAVGVQGLVRADGHHRMAACRRDHLVRPTRDPPHQRGDGGGVRKIRATAGQHPARHDRRATQGPFAKHHRRQVRRCLDSVRRYRRLHQACERHHTNRPRAFS